MLKDVSSIEAQKQCPSFVAKDDITTLKLFTIHGLLLMLARMDI